VRQQERPAAVPLPSLSDYDANQLGQMLEKHKMRYFETSACSGSNIENMFFAMIDEINVLQQTKRKRIDS
jgi:hypothetical protein